MAIPTGVVVKSIALFAGMSAIIQTAVPVIDLTFIDKAERVSMEGLLIAAVVILWRKLQEKDTLLMVNYKAMADALAVNNQLVSKMTDTLDRIDTAVERLSTVRSAISG